MNCAVSSNYQKAMGKMFLYLEQIRIKIELKGYECIFFLNLEIKLSFLYVSKMIKG
jgi:hypothetical protein